MVSDQTTLDYTAPNKNTQIIQIDICGTEIGKNYKNTFGLMGDAKSVLEGLLAKASNKKNSSWVAMVKNLVDDTLERQRELFDSQEHPIQTARLLKELSDLLPDDTIVVADTGWSAVWSATMLRMKRSQSYIRAAGSLGWSLPASMGAKCAAPGRTVVCFLGDGAFYYHLSELETAVRYGINIVVVINNNSRLGQCIPFVQEAYINDENKYEDYKRKITFSPVDFVKIAEGLGAEGIRVENPEEIHTAIRKALSIKKPCVVEVLTDCMSRGPLSPSI